MEGIIYPTLDQAKAIHAKTIEYSGGGTYEHFDLGRLDSVLMNTVYRLKYSKQK